MTFKLKQNVGIFVEVLNNTTSAILMDGIMPSILIVHESASSTIQVRKKTQRIYVTFEVTNSH